MAGASGGTSTTGQSRKRGGFDQEMARQGIRRQPPLSAHALGTPDPELEGLLKTKNVSSKVIFGHIRAATDGDLNQVNAHPFQFHKLLWMHNGGVANKTKVGCPSSPART
eukprot:109266-Rhodomonas_salina.2